MQQDKNAELKALRDEYGAKLDEMDELLDAADKQDRQLRSSEKRRYDALDLEAKRVRGQIDRLMRDLQVGEYSPGVGGSSRGGSGTRYTDVESGREVRAYRHGERVSQRGDDEPGFASAVGGMVRRSLGYRLSDRERRAMDRTDGESGGFAINDELSTDFIDALRERSAISRAGATFLPVEDGAFDKLHIAGLASDPAVSWQAGEGGAVGEGEPELMRITFDFKTGATMAKPAVQIVQDSANLEPMIEHSLSQAAAAEVDRVALWGAGGDEPAGVTGATGVGVVNHDGELTSWAPFVQAIRQLADSGVPMDGLAAIMSPRDWQTLESLTDTTNQPLRRPESVQALNRLVSTKVPTNGGTGSDESEIVVGDFSRVVVAMRQQVRVEVLSELFRENLQIGILCWFRVDVQIEKAAALALISGITPPA